MFASHSEENIDESVAMGRLINLDSRIVAEGKPNQVWNVDGFAGGYASPAIHEGILYHADNSANLTAFDVETGEQLWLHNLGIAQKASPVIADGKAYVADVDGKFHILKLNGRKEPEVLDVEEFKNADGSATQINGSPAVANGRVFLMTTNNLYAIGEKRSAGKSSAVPAVANEAPAGAAPAQLLIFPAEVILSAGASKKFVARAYDAKGRLIGETESRWSLDGLRGTVSASGELKLSSDASFQGGLLVATAGGLKAAARVSARPAAPFAEDFEGYAEKTVPPGWNATRGRFQVADLDGNKVLRKGSDNRRSWRTTVYVGDPDASGYILEADLMADQRGRFKPDMGLVSHRYTVAMMGGRRQLMIRTWLSELKRFSKVIPFDWQVKVWYRMKVRVDPGEGGSTVRVKVWKKSEAEPAGWTLEATDPLPHAKGSPGIYGYSAADIFYDNFTVTSAGN